MDVKYAKPTNDRKNDIRISKVLNRTSKINLYGNRYYIINTEAPKKVIIYDTLTNELKGFYFTSVIVDINNFFLCDIDNDNNPEIFILHSGIIPRDYIMSYSIYSLRKDSASIEVK
jgi:hypothetical protein